MAHVKTWMLEDVWLWITLSSCFNGISFGVLKFDI